jgi:methyl-accepting chemotaxis protein
MMKSFFSPSVRLMNRLSYLQKFSLIGMFFLLPIGLTLYLLISDLNAQLGIVKSEKQGIVYNSAVRHFIEDTQQHRGLANIVLNGEPAYANALLQKESLIQEDIQKVNVVEVQLNNN